MYYNLVLFQIEIIVFLASIGYIVYYLFDKIMLFFVSLKNIVWIHFKKPDAPITTIDISEDKNLHAQVYNNDASVITPEDKLKIQDLLKKIQVNISKMEYDLAKNLIVEGLAIDKFNIELNLELAGIYITEENFGKAEYIYKDLLLVHQEDHGILKKLAYVLTMQEKYELALEMYKKAYDLKEDDTETIDMLSQLYYYKWNYIDAIAFLKLFLKEQPRNIESLILLAASYKQIGKILDAINTYGRVLEVDPYNQEVKSVVEELKNLDYVSPEA